MTVELEVTELARVKHYILGGIMQQERKYILGGIMEQERKWGEKEY